MSGITGYFHLILKATFGSPQDRLEARYQLVSATAKRWGFRIYHCQATWHQDEEFENVLEGFPGQGGYTAKRYNLYYLARGVADLNGDTAECGVATGVTSYLICHATKKPDRLHHAFDSFEGLPEPGDVDKPGAAVQPLKKGDFAVEIDQVRRNLSAFEHVRLYKGWIPERFDDIADRLFAFVHIDVDFYEPTLDSLRFFYKRTVPSGIIICDDYGYLGTPGARQAMIDFFEDKREPIVKLAAGHALIIKQ